MIVVARTLCIALTLLLAACSAAAPGHHRGGLQLRIGLLTSLTGQRTTTGREALNGANLAVAMVNDGYRELQRSLTTGHEPPRPDGTRLVLRVADTRADPEHAIGQSTNLITSERVQAMVTADTAEVTAATSQRLERLMSAPIVDANNSASYLTELGLDRYFRLGPTDHMLGQELFSMLHEQARRGTVVHRLALVQADGPDEASVAKEVRELATESGYQIAPIPDSDLVVAIASTSDSATNMLKSLQADDAPPVVGLGDGFIRLTNGSLTPSRPVLRIVPWSADLAQRSRAAKVVSAMYSARYDAPMTAAAAGTFTAVLTLAAVAGKTGSADPDRLRSALAGLRVSGNETIMPWNGIRFDPDGQNNLAAGVVEQLLDGRFQVVAPNEIATTPPVWGHLAAH